MILVGITPLYKCEGGSFKGELNCTNIFKGYARLFNGGVDPGFIFMDDNVCPHKSARIGEVLESEDCANGVSLLFIRSEHDYDAFGRGVVNCLSLQSLKRGTGNILTEREQNGKLAVNTVLVLP